jgi:hypothetical protein
MPSLKAKVKKKTVEERKIIHAAKINEATEFNLSNHLKKMNKIPAYNAGWINSLEFLNFLHQFDETKYKIVIYGHKDGGPKIARKGSGPFSRVGVSMMRIA